ncbi:uncharacterized protein LOC130711645 [Lotus japonicus]|uniref:uncharacterized protein LOC130711645 n=1 Tax=Lotus japonicus TaxID=34305 RepID=UPI0025906E66|nr:uncharacterized protein LOC130711645 [Lotus japonicus]
MSSSSKSTVCSRTTSSLANDTLYDAMDISSSSVSTNADEVQTFSGCSSSDESEDSEDGERDDMPCSKNLDEFEEYSDIGDMKYECQYCGALHWKPPTLLWDLIMGNDVRSQEFLANIRSYNSAFAFTSFGGKIESGLNDGGGPPQFVISGQNYHRIGSLLPNVVETPKFAQLYVYDTQNEIQNQSSHFRNSDGSCKLNKSLIEDLLAMVDECNVLVKSFRKVRDFISINQLLRISLRLFRARPKDPRVYNLPSVDEVAGLIVGDFDSTDCGRDIVVSSMDGTLRRIHETHTSFLPLQYPLLFPNGEDGYKEDILFRQDGDGRVFKKIVRVSLREFISFRIHERMREDSVILRSRRLFQQFLVDCYSMIEAQRLSYIKGNQKTIRRDFLSGLEEAMEKGDVDSASVGTRIVLPSSFTGGRRYMFNNCQDAMAICKHVGYPDLFITVTCNPKWLEIQRCVSEKGLNAYDRPDISCRVFHIKVKQLMRDLRKGQYFGKVSAGMYTIEFQKRGLPHAHILIWLAPGSKLTTPEKIDSVICAELPDPVASPKLFEVVSMFMVHGPCGSSRKNSPCMVNGRCSKFFPKKYVDKTSFDIDGYPTYRRRNTGVFVERRDVQLDNGYVVPYNAKLLMKYQAHINIEYCKKSNCIKYLFKYINKGVDRVTVSMKNECNEGQNVPEVDEIQQYYDCRYLSACEAAWRSFSFRIHDHWPPVQRLPFHMPNKQVVLYGNEEPIDRVVQRGQMSETMFTGWMVANMIYEHGRHLTYAEYPQLFVWHPKDKEWRPRKRGFSIGRMNFIPLGCGEVYYLRLLLNLQCGCTSYADLRTVDGVVRVSFQEACSALGLLEDDKEFIDGLIDCAELSGGMSVRKLFMVLLLSNSIVTPGKVFEETWRLLADGILYKRRKLLCNPTLRLDDQTLKTLCLVELEKMLVNNGKTLKDFPGIPYPISDEVPQFENVMLFNELRFDIDDMSVKHNDHLMKLNNGQRKVYDEVIDAVNKSDGGFYFVYGSGGTGKTFLWKTLSYRLRSERKIVLNVASSGIASLLLPGGRTAHSLFSIPLVLNEDSCCNIRLGSNKAELLKHTSLIIWDEAPMVNRWAFEAVDRTLRDIMEVGDVYGGGKPFGGKVVVLGEDFRQTLPIIPKASREEIVMATINSSRLWKFCKVLKLTENMRLHGNDSLHDCEKLVEFSKWILDIGDGNLGDYNDGECDLDIPHDLMVLFKDDVVSSIVYSTYPDIQRKFFDEEYFIDKAILAPTLDIVDSVNQFVLSIVPGKEKVYLSSDSVVKVDEDVAIDANWITIEFLNDIKGSGLPDHRLCLKIGTPIMLMRNIDVSAGLCNGTRLIVLDLRPNLIYGKVLNGNKAGTKTYIPHMTIVPSDSGLHVKVQRRWGRSPMYHLMEGMDSHKWDQVNLQGWSGYFNRLDGPIYNKLVVEFWKNVVCNDYYVVSHVLDKKIVISEESIAKLLGMEFQQGKGL